MKSIVKQRLSSIFPTLKFTKPSISNDKFYDLFIFNNTSLKNSFRHSFISDQIKSSLLKSLTQRIVQKEEISEINKQHIKEDSEKSDLENFEKSESTDNSTKDKDSKSNKNALYKEKVYSRVPSDDISHEELDHYINLLCSQSLSAFNNNKNKQYKVFFDSSISIEIRKKILNSLILNNYSYSLKKENKSNTEKKLNSDFIFHLDDNFSNNLAEIKHQFKLSLSTLETRELCNTRANIATTDYLYEYGKNIAMNFNEQQERNKSTSKTDKPFTKSIEIKKIEGEDLKTQGYNLIYNVGKAAKNKPKIVSFTYYGNSKSKNISHAILGKGLTFDTGGLNIKGGKGMINMFYDKHGACNVLSLLNFVSNMNLNLNIAFVIGLAENSVDSDSYRPSDIIESKNGLTVEVGNTDAEGRLVLADCLTYIQEEFKAKTIIDLATLTGACKVGLGQSIAGLFSNDDNLSAKLLNSSK